MSCKDIFIYIALFAIVAAAAKPEARQHHQHDDDHHGNDHHGDHHGNHHHGHDHHGHDHHGHEPIPADLLNPEVAPTLTVDQPLPTQEEIVVEEGSEYEDRQEDVEDIDVPEADVISEEANTDNRKITNLKRQEESDDQIQESDDELNKSAVWVDCTYNPSSRLSCSDCRTRLICKYPGGGKLLNCPSNWRPYCNNGYCSAVPSAGCA